jgi:exodeoxyribonuclease VII large subunit
MQIPTLTVNQLNRQIRLFLEQDIGEISVIGELSNFAKPASGHFYFTLKDNAAQLKCAFFKNYQATSKHPFADGQQVIARGLVSLYEARGEYQLIVYELTPYGLGELYRQFELLKAKLEQQGLFAQSRKRTLPLYPERIAVITSQHGAALHDILVTLARRYPLVEVDVYPCEVQGKNAAPQLIKRLKQVNAHKERPCDLIILARGGGSLEDLWAFNDEQLAYALFTSTIPVVTGIGHESDVTIADFVADLRAATPTAAAEAATPNQEALFQLVDATLRRLTRAMHGMVTQHQLTLKHLCSKLTYPGRLLHQQAQTLDFLQHQLQHKIQQRLQHETHRMNVALIALTARNPAHLIQRATARLQTLQAQLHQAIQQQIQQHKKNLATTAATLHAVSPLATLDRGYALVTHHNHLVQNSNQIQRGDTINVKLAHGILFCEVVDKQ